MLLSRFVVCNSKKIEIYYRAAGKRIVELIRNQNYFEQDTIIE